MGWLLLFIYVALLKTWCGLPVCGAGPPCDITAIMVWCRYRVRARFWGCVCWNNVLMVCGWARGSCQHDSHPTTFPIPYPSWFVVLRVVFAHSGVDLQPHFASAIYAAGWFQHFIAPRSCDASFARWWYAAITAYYHSPYPIWAAFILVVRIYLPPLCWNWANIYVILAI